MSDTNPILSVPSAKPVIRRGKNTIQKPRKRKESVGKALGGHYHQELRNDATGLTGDATTRTDPTFLQMINTLETMAEANLV